MNYFRATDFLLPNDCDMEKWAVIACDQYTSQPEYWDQVKNFVADAPSTLQMFFAEADLAKIKSEDYERFIHNMDHYLNSQFFKEYPNSYIYVERSLVSGQIRSGVIGVVDLEYYDYDPKANTKIFATEATVLQRVPPRVALRRNASLEFSHTVVFCDDPQCKIIESVTNVRELLPVLYDFDLMCDGGHITGYLLAGEHARNFEKLIAEYEAENAYLVGDGNHSLVTAKLSYEEQKDANPNINWSEHPARYGMIELENIHSPSMLFEPIYRILVCPDPEAFLTAFRQEDCCGGVPVTWIRGENTGTVHLSLNEGELIIEALQRILDQWAASNPVTVDYIHGADTVRELAQNDNTIGFLVPDIEKSILFPYILSGKVMPKKTFSIGHATEKRYYLEGRRIK